MCNTWLIYVWALWLTPFRCPHRNKCVFTSIHMCNTWLVYVCNTWLIYVCVHLNRYPRWLRRRCDSYLFICVTWLIHMCNTWLIHMCVYIWINPYDFSAAIGGAAIFRCHWWHTHTLSNTLISTRNNRLLHVCIHVIDTCSNIQMQVVRIQMYTHISESVVARMNASLQMSWCVVGLRRRCDGYVFKCIHT